MDETGQINEGIFSNGTVQRPYLETYGRGMASLHFEMENNTQYEVNFDKNGFTGGNKIHKETCYFKRFDDYNEFLEEFNYL